MPTGDPNGIVRTRQPEGLPNQVTQCVVLIGWIYKRPNACFAKLLSFAGLVAIARSLNPIPSRTRPLNSSAPMVLCLKTWESRSPPGLQRTAIASIKTTHNAAAKGNLAAAFCCVEEGWGLIQYGQNVVERA